MLVSFSPRGVSWWRSDDPGWLRTVDQYHTEYVRIILDNIVASLTAHPRRKFIQVEVAFFARWWADQSSATKDAVRALVANGQLEFVNGGWTMADEAVNTYEAMVNQLTYGTDFLRRELNVTVDIAWHIGTGGWLLTRAGRECAVHAR